MLRRLAVGLGVAAAIGCVASPAFAHEERSATVPEGRGEVPAHRSGGPQILVCNGNFNVFRDNWVYGQEYAGFVLFWVPAPRRGDGPGKLFDTSHHNRYSGNHLGVTRTGEYRRNGLDVWWDGAGRDNRWAPGTSEPATLPSLGGIATARIAGDPYKTLKLLECSRFDASSATIPSTCDWYGATGLSRIEVRAAAVHALLLVLAALALPRRRPWAHASAAAGVLGAVLAVAGVAYEGSRVGALGSLVLAAWWLSTGRLLRRGREAPGLAWTALVLGGLAALDAIDRGLAMLPIVPISLGRPILLISLNWVGWILAGVGRSVARSGAHSTSARTAATWYA